MGQGAAYASGADGTLWSWGHNFSGALGAGIGYDPRGAIPGYWNPSLARVLNVHDVVQVAAGGYVRTCVRERSGTVWCWGEPGSDEAGVPRRVVGVDDAVDIDVGLDDACVVRSSGRLTCFKANDGSDAADFDPINDAVKVAVGSEHKCVIRAGNDVVCWGKNEFGQLGDGTFEDSPTTPVQVVGLP